MSSFGELGEFFPLLLRGTGGAQLSLKLIGHTISPQGRAVVTAGQTTFHTHLFIAFS